MAESSLHPLPIAARDQLFPDCNFSLKTLLLQDFNFSRAFLGKKQGKQATKSFSPIEA